MQQLRLLFVTFLHREDFELELASAGARSAIHTLVRGFDEMALSNSCSDPDLGERIDTSDNVTRALFVAFGTRFELWKRDGSWRRDSSVEVSSSTTEESSSTTTPHAASEMYESPEMAALLEARFCSDGPVVRPMLEGVNVVIFPVERRSRKARAAVGFVPGKDPARIQRHAREVDLSIERSNQLDEQRQQLDSYAEQVTVDFEELTWLRSLVEQIEYCDASNTFESVAAGVLQPLRDLIRAKSLVLIPDEVIESGNAVGTLALDERFWSGSTDVSFDAIRLLIERFGEQATTQPIVNNQVAENEALGEGVSNFILLRVAKTDFEFGWLLALNRTAADAVPIADLGHLPPQLSEFEFGTVEASLVQAASVVLATHARNVDLFESHANLLIGVVRSMINALDAKDAYTSGHSDRVALMGQRIGEQMGLDERTCQQLYMSGLLHDIGKIGVPDDVLGKPGKLTDEEFEQIKRHPVIGYDILKHLDQLSYALPGVLHHHESFDGTGYPHGLAGEEIPLFGRILAVADAFDAMTSDRPYRSGMPFLKAVEDCHAICRKYSGNTQSVDSNLQRSTLSML
jgi:HD-GYP domain-containing protein (c-di-GMP phosphodiesterase class II)